MRKSTLFHFVAASAMVAMGCTPEADPARDESSVDPQVAAVRAFAQKHRGVMPKRDPSFYASKPTAAAANLLYYGGRVVSNIKVRVVFWGNSGIDANVHSGIQGFYQSATNSPYWTWLTEYNTNRTAVGGQPGTNQTIGNGTAFAPVTITPGASGTTVSDTQIKSELTSQIAAGHLPAPDLNTYYAIFFPQGVTITQGGSRSCVGGGFCAYHGTVAASGSHTEFFYGVHPDMSPGSGCDTGCGSDSNPFNNVTSVASHELVETTTDAEVGLAQSNGPPLAWYDTSNGEIGDICNADQGQIPGTNYVAQAEWSNQAGACIISKGTCTPTCTGKSCGSDGCGGSCGTCPSGQTCSATGQCQGGGGGCAHDKCSTGRKLTRSCDPCVTQICTVDSFCCNVTWDSFCVDEVGSVCGESC